MSHNLLNGIIKSIKINFRSLKDAEIPLGRKLTLLSGHNGTMKSTVLGLLIQPFTIGKELSEEDKKCFRGIDGEFLTGKFSKNITFAYPEYDAVDCLKAEISLYDGFYENNLYKYQSIRRSDTDSLRVYAPTRQSGKGYLYGVPVGCLYLDRLFPISAMVDKASDKKQSCTPQIIDMEEKYQKIFMEYYNKILPKRTITSFSAIKFQEKEVIDTTFENRDYRSMSSGEDIIAKTIFTIVSLIRSRDLLGNKYKGSLLVMDEIESSLHPPAAIKLFRLLKNISSKYNIQTVVTTHSIALIEDILYSMEQANKNASTKDDFSFVYLKAFDDKIDVLLNQPFVSIKNHLLLESQDDPKIPLLVEDEEAKLLAEQFLKAEYKKLVDIKTSIGCQELISLNERKVFDEVSRSIILLDGDNRNRYKKEEEKNQNIFVLPGTLNPERYIHDYLDQLSDRHEFWQCNQAKYEKSHFQHRASEYDLASREHAKKWFQAEKKFLMPSHAKNVFFYLKQERKSEIEEFNRDFVECYNQVCVHYLLPKIQDDLIETLKQEIYIQTNKNDLLKKINSYFFELVKKRDKKEFYLYELDSKVYYEETINDISIPRQGKTNSFRFFIQREHKDEVEHVGNAKFRKKLK